MSTIADSAAWRELQDHAKVIAATKLADVCKQPERAELAIKAGDMRCDYSRSKVTPQTLQLLKKLAEEAKVEAKRNQMLAGGKINETEGRAVLHTALRAPKTKKVEVDGKDVVPDVHQVLDQVKAFAAKIRSGEHKGATGKKLDTVICVGIGGSYLSVEFVHEALKTDSAGMEASAGRQLRFLANVDPIDVRRALHGVDPETTLVIIISKTFTTAETMLNARTVKAWLVGKLGKDAIAKHVVAVSTALEKTSAFGIDPANVFGFWDWVGGRFSVCSAVGMLPLSLQYGSDVVQKFLDGCHWMDNHFENAPMCENIPMLMGLLAVWNS